MAKLTIDLLVSPLPAVADAPGGIDVGLQDKASQVHPGQPVPGGGMRFRCEVDVVRKDGRVDFAGPFVHGRPGERFLYLSWKRRAGGEAPWAQRVKTPLAGLAELCAADAGTTAAEADISGRRPHDTAPIRWRAV